MTAKKKQKAKVDWKIICTGIVCLTAAEIVALTQGLNGTLLKMFLVIVALAIGVAIPNPLRNAK